MGYERGEFGIEFSTSPGRDRQREPGTGILAFLAVSIAAAALAFSAIRGCGETPKQASSAPKPRERQNPAVPRSAGKAPEIARMEAAAISESLETGDLARLESDGSAAARMLVGKLARLNESKDLVAAIDTIEELRSLPDAKLAADDFLAGRLGDLNMQLLMSGRENRLTAEVEFGAGSSLSRLAREHGTTVAAIVRLNSIEDPNRVRAGRKLRVLEHPKFRLEVDSRKRRADLYLAGRFFKRYTLLDAPFQGEREVSAKEGAVTALKNLGISTSPADRDELAMFLSRGSFIRVE